MKKETGQQRKRRLEEERRAQIKEWATEMFDPAKSEPTSVKAASSIPTYSREYCGLVISDAAWRVHQLLLESAETRGLNDEELARWSSRACLTAERVTTAIEELCAAELLAVETGPGGTRQLNPHTAKYLLS